LNRIDIPIVLVQLGPVSRQLKSNLRYLCAIFPEREKVIITDIERCQWIMESGFTVVRAEELAITWPDNFEINDRRKYFRENFWFLTKARLILIVQYMLQTKTLRIIHFENDVWINPRFPFDYFENLDAPLAFPRVDNSRGIASVLYVNGTVGMSILNNACSKWPKLTDMEILGKIIDEDKRVHILDSYERSANLAEHWIFDGAKMGMYLFGADPRNSWGIVKRFDMSPMGSLLTGDEIDIHNGILSVGTRVKHREIANLHIHSKNREIFAVSWEESIKSQLRKKQEGRSQEFILMAFIFVLNELAGRVCRKIFNLILKPLNLNR